MEELHPIPALNPDTLQKICLEYILLWIKRLTVTQQRDVCILSVLEFMIALSSIGRRVESSNAVASIKKAEFSDEDDEVDREHFR